MLLKSQLPLFELGDWQDAKRRSIYYASIAMRGVVELKRTEDGGHLDLQALRYAAMGFSNYKGGRAPIANFRRHRQTPRHS